MNNLEKFVAKIKTHRICFGAGIWFSDPLISEIFCEIGYDFIWIDTEHATSDNRIVLSHIMATKGTDTAPFVRVSGRESFIVQPVLELGPAAVIFPFINSKEDAVNAIKACRYPPEGKRGFGPIRSNRFYMEEIEQYFQKSKNNPWVILQIEHIDAVKNLDSILEVGGFNSIVIGPHDLSASLGFPGRPRSSEVLKVIETIAGKANKKGIPVGIATAIELDDLPFFESLKSMGINWICMIGDFDTLITKPCQVLEKMRTLSNKTGY